MLTIRSEQMQAMGAYTRAQFEQRIIKHLRKKFPARTQDQSDQKIQFVVQAGINLEKSVGSRFLAQALDFTALQKNAHLT